MSAAIITGRRRKRSTHAPANRPKRRCGRPAAAASTPKAIGDAPRLKAASSGSATAVNCEPTADADWAAHNRAKSPSRAMPRARLTFWRNVVRLVRVPDDRAQTAHDWGAMEGPRGLPAPWSSVIDSMPMLAPGVARASAMWR